MRPPDESASCPTAASDSVTDAGRVCSETKAAPAVAGEARGEGWGGAVGGSRGGRGDVAGGPAKPCTSGAGDAADEEEGGAGVAAGEEEGVAGDGGKVYTAERWFATYEPG